MKKLMIPLVALSLLAVPASAKNFGTDTVPSLLEIIEGYKMGKYQRYPGVVRETESGLRIGPSSGYLFADHLEAGTILPRIADARALLKAAKQPQVVMVASAGERVRYEIRFPVFEEIARQNKVSYWDLMDHLMVNAYEDERGDVIRDVHSASVVSAEAAQMIIDAQVQDDIVEVPVEVPVEIPVVTPDPLTPLELYENHFLEGGNADSFIDEYPEYEELVDELEAESTV